MGSIGGEDLEEAVIAFEDEGPFRSSMRAETSAVALEAEWVCLVGDDLATYAIMVSVARRISVHFIASI